MRLESMEMTGDDEAARYAYSQRTYKVVEVCIGCCMSLSDQEHCKLMLGMTTICDAGASLLGLI